MRVASLIMALCAALIGLGVAEKARVSSSLRLGPDSDDRSRAGHVRRNLALETKNCAALPIGSEEHPQTADLFGRFRHMPGKLLGRRGVVHLAML